MSNQVFGTDLGEAKRLSEDTARALLLELHSKWGAMAGDWRSAESRANMRRCAQITKILLQDGYTDTEIVAEMHRMDKDGAR